MNTSKKLTLSILVPTYNRKKQFERLYNRLCSKFSNNPYYEIVVACSSPEYMPKVSKEWNITCLNTKGYTREENYLKGVAHCRGKYTLIVEDDDIVDTETIYTFVYEHLANNPDADLFVYSLMHSGQSCIMPETKIISKDEFLTTFNSFQWGRFITKTSVLKKALYNLWVVEKETDILHSLSRDVTTVCVSDYKLISAK